MRSSYALHTVIDWRLFWKRTPKLSTSLVIRQRNSLARLLELSSPGLTKPGGLGIESDEIEAMGAAFAEAYRRQAYGLTNA